MIRMELDYKNFVKLFKGQKQFSQEGLKRLYNLFDEYKLYRGHLFDPYDIFNDFIEFKDWKELQEVFPDIKDFNQLGEVTIYFPFGNRILVKRW